MNNSNTKDNTLNRNDINIMVDLETVGVNPGCKILSISAVYMRLNAKDGEFGTVGEYPTGECFNVHCDLESQNGVLKEEVETLLWWNNRPSELRTRLFEPTVSSSIVCALSVFNEWLESFKEYDTEKIIIWGKGADFDIPILNAAYKAYDITPAYYTFGARCFRTLEKIGQALEISVPAKQGQNHCGLDDAMFQAVYAERIIEKLMEFNSSVKEDTCER